MLSNMCNLLSVIQKLITTVLCWSSSSKYNSSFKVSQNSGLSIPNMTGNHEYHLLLKTVNSEIISALESRQKWQHYLIFLASLAYHDHSDNNNISLGKLTKIVCQMVFTVISQSNNTLLETFFLLPYMFSKFW